MNEGLALRSLQEVMQWTEAQAKEQDEWLKLMSRYKFDGYQEFLAGARFVECLVDWLQQFKAEHRQAAYDFVRNRLVFINTAELHHLVARFYDEIVFAETAKLVAIKLNVPSYLVWKNPEAKKFFEEYRRKSLFIGLSDGARVDVFRRANEGRITNDQVSVSFEIHADKWTSIHNKLKKAMADEGAKFTNIYLFDDFVGSCTTLLRCEDGKWDGKLFRFWEQNQARLKEICDDNYKIHIHHFIGTQYGIGRVDSALAQASKELAEKGWFKEIKVSYGLRLPKELPIDATTDPAFFALTDTYYDKVIETDSTRKGGKTVKLGFGECALPLILEHNTPNNSLALLWAETQGKDGAHSMRPLFRRKQRHWQE
jgi:hypothetical protein